MTMALSLSREPKEAPVSEIAEKTDNERKKALATAVTNLVAQGRRVESQADFYAVLVKGQRPNRTAHLIATIFTFGIWGWVWLAIELLGGEKRESVAVDEYGNVQVQRL